MVGTDSVTVYPLSLGDVAAVPEHFQNLPAVDVSVTVLSQGGVKPADPCSPRDRVQAESPNALGVVAVDGVAHRSFVVESILQGRRAQSRSEMCQRPHCP